MEGITDQRAAKFKQVAHQRQTNLTIILENVHDPHNISAVLRTADSVGVKEIFVVYTDPRLDREHLELNKRTSSGANKWVDVHFYTDLKACMTHVRKNYDHIFTTHLAEDSKSLYELDLTASIALFFGNERDGLSEEALSYTNGNFIIPQMGMVQSLNISVACAVCLYEAHRQRDIKGMYQEHTPSTDYQKKAMFHSYYLRHFNRIDPFTTTRIND